MRQRTIHRGIEHAETNAQQARVMGRDQNLGALESDNASAWDCVSPRVLKTLFRRAPTGLLEQSEPKQVAVPYSCWFGSLFDKVLCRVKRRRTTLRVTETFGGAP